MEEHNQTDEFNDPPRCHYCQRYAFEITFQSIAVCDKCLDKMTKGRPWFTVRSADGAVFVTTSDGVLHGAQQFEVLGAGTFAEMWSLSHKDDPNYG